MIALQRRKSPEWSDGRPRISAPAPSPSRGPVTEVVSPTVARAAVPDVLSRQLAAAVQLRADAHSGPMLMRGPHNKGYYKIEGANGTVYWRWCKKRSDAQESSFRQAVMAAAGGTRGRMQFPDSEPDNGTEI